MNSVLILVFFNILVSSQASPDPETNVHINRAQIELKDSSKGGLSKKSGDYNSWITKPECPCGGCPCTPACGCKTCPCPPPPPSCHCDTCPCTCSCSGCPCQKPRPCGCSLCPCGEKASDYAAFLNRFTGETESDGKHVRWNADYRTDYANAPKWRKR